MEFLDFFKYEFVQNAYISCMIISVIAGLIGSLVVVNKLVFAAEGVAHSAFGGIGIALFLGVSPYLGATVFTLLMCLIIAYISLHNRENTDTVIGVIMAVSMALGIIFINITPGYKSEPMNYLFGNILTVGINDIYVISLLSLIIIFIIMAVYRNLLAVSFDPEFCKVRGLNVSFYYFLLICMIGLSVILVIKVVGLILFIALITIPPFIVGKYSGSLKKMMFYSILISAFITISGLTISLIYNLSASGMIVLSGGILFFSDFLIHRFIFLKR